jgi:hypothetical protein
MLRSPLGITVAISLLPGLTAQASWVLRAAPVAPSARAWHGLAPGPGNTIVLFGGSTFGAYHGDTWILDGAGWRQATPGVAPPARMQHGMVFDMLRGCVLLFGGLANSNPTYLDDTWEWDGGAWRQRSTSARPTARAGFAMGYDPLRGTTVLFGGVDASSLAGASPLGDTWEWNGLTWAQKSTPTAPPARYACAMAFDFVNLRMLLFGGLRSSGYFVDTWDYDGVSWQLRSPAHSPSVRHFPAMASDPQRNRVVLFGGGMIWALADTWDWDGSDWLQRVPGARPSGRWGAAQVTDLARNRIVLFGGTGTDGTNSWTILADTWEFFTTAVPSAAPLAPGCAGSAGIPALGAQQPWLGDVLQIAVDHRSPGAPALLAVGMSSTTWGTLSLPASLSALGMPGCALAVSVDATIPMTGPLPSCTLTLPPNNAFAGMSLFAQALVVDREANPAGCVLSSALTLQLGAR